MTFSRAALAVPAVLLLSACQSTEPPPYALTPPARDTLYAPRQVIPGRLEYAQEPDTFAPVLTQRAAYPTQEQANYAFQRDNVAAYYPTKGPYVARVDETPASPRRAVRVHLFACKPGTLNDVTGRIEPARGLAVHCATDFFNANGERVSRETVNYYYDRDAWRMIATRPPTTPAPWINPERSPTDYFSWLPFGARSTPYRN